MKHRHLVVLIVVMLVAMGSAGKALADDAPPGPPPAGSIESGEYSTMVQMESENVIMTITDDIAYIKATFNMRNQGTEEEAFDVRFPLFDRNYMLPGTVHNFAAYVDGESAEVVYVSDPHTGTEPYWATWHVTFPAGLPVTLGVIYQVDPYNPNASEFPEYSYILETGAGWHGPIGEGTITVRLPYDVDMFQTPFRARPPGYVVSGTDIVWSFTDLEPTTTDNIHITISSPELVKSMQSAQQQADEHPESVDAYLKLARALAKPLWFSLGSEETVDRACTAYERVLELAPNNVNIHIEYLELLQRVSAWKLVLLPDQFQPILEHALELAPDDERVLEIQDGYNDYLDYVAKNPDLFDLPSPTWMPMLVQSVTPALADMPTVTPMIIDMPTPTPSSDDRSPSGDGLQLGLWAAIGAVVIGGAAAGVWVYRKRRVA